MIGTSDLDNNPFLDLADQQLTAPRQRRLRAAERRAEKKAGKALVEKDALSKAWRAWRREQRAALLAGLYGVAARALSDFLQSMQMDSAAALIDLVEAGPWRQADADIRFEVLRQVDEAIVELRERHGLDPFDDPLPFSDAKPNAFLTIREALA